MRGDGLIEKEKGPPAGSGPLRASGGERSGVGLVDVPWWLKDCEAQNP